jgi:hypothetical protein
MRKIHTLLLTGLAGCVASLPAQITIGENLSATGFIDMSAQTSDAGDTLGFNQWEIDFNFTPSEGLAATVDLNDKGNGAEVEQAYVSLDMGGGLGLKAGLFLTALGYEGAEPIFLNQVSPSATTAGIYAGYANGIAATYGNDLGTLYVSVVDGSYSGDQDADDLSFEAQLKMSPMEGLTLQAAYASEDYAAVAEDLGAGVAAADAHETSIANFWAQYQTGALTLAAEYNSLSEYGSSDNDGEGFLVMVNYALSDKLSLTLRHSGVEWDSGAEHTEYTICPNYAVSDNLLTRLEFRSDEYTDSSQDDDTVAAELIFTF